MPSVAAIGPKTGTPAPALKPSSDCVKLDQQNQKKRAALAQETSDQSVIGPNGNGRGTTVSSCQSVTGSSRRMRSAHSNQKAHDKVPRGLVSGGNRRVRQGRKKTTCDYVHPDPAMQKSGHAEARLLDSMAGGTMPSQITFNIDWRKRTGSPSKMPCMTCHRYLCKVQQDCDVEIFLCDKSNQKHKLPCPPNRKNRRELKSKLDRRPRSR